MPQTFNFPYHKVSTRHPQQGTNLKLGGSWSYNSKPSSPPQRVFTLEFKILKYYGAAGALDLVTDSEINLGALEAFYNAHLQHTEFFYPHPIYGALRVKFQKPLEIPTGIEGGGGAIAGIGLLFIEQPS